MTDIVPRLRASVKACRALDRSELLEEAAAEIQRRTLTEYDRDTIEIAIMRAEAQCHHELAASLRSIVERLA